MKNRRGKQILAFCAALLLVCSFLFAAFFIAEEIEHDCTGEECPICECIQGCEALLEQVGTGLAVVFAVVLVVAFFVQVLSEYTTSFLSGTLVSHKIRLNI